MVRQWQELFYDERYSEVPRLRVPDYVKLAEAYGALGLRCDQAEDVDATLEKALATDDQSVVVDFGSTPTKASSRWSRPAGPASSSSAPVLPEEQAAATRREVRT